MNIPELIQQHVGTLEERVESLKSELTAALSRATQAEALADSYRKQALENDTWLGKIRRLLSAHNMVRGDYEQSVQSLIQLVKEHEGTIVSLRARIVSAEHDTVSAPAAMAKDRTIEQLKAELTQARMDRNQAVSFLRDRQSLNINIGNFLSDFSDDDTDY